MARKANQETASRLRGRLRLPGLLKPALFSLSAAFILAGCATMQPLESASPHMVDPSEALLALSPGAGAILSVVETGYVNAVEQTISLDTRSRTPGQNYITIQKFEAIAHSSTPGGLQDVPLANLDLAGEARGTVSYADMKLSPYFVQNLYGPFGYSMGRTATADLCMYAWQRVVADMKPGGGVKRGAINIRALICDSEKSEQELLGVMLQLRIKGVTGQARSAPQLVGAYGVIIEPIGATGPADVLKTPVAPPSPPVIVRTPTAVSTPAVPAEDPSGPVPWPSGTPAPSGQSPQTVPAPSGSQPAVPAPAAPSAPSSDAPIIPLPTLTQSAPPGGPSMSQT
jgi:hypothetical protein